MVTIDAEKLAAEAHELTSGTYRYEPVRLINIVLVQSRLLELIARGLPLTETLDAMLVYLERDMPDMLCSVLLLDPDRRHLRHGAGPSLPEQYRRAIDGAPIGPRAGSCGTAAYRGTQVVVSDIEMDPLWEDYRVIARPHGLRACWSTPILDPTGRVVGTFAMYFRQPRTPTREHERLIDVATHVASVAIAKDLGEKVTRDLAERYRLLNLATNDVVWDWDVKRNTLWWGDGVQRLLGYSESEVTNDFDWWVERVHPDDRSRVEASLQKAAQRGTSWSEDYRFLRQNGTYADIQDRGYVMWDASGATIRMIGTMQDISERKRAQERSEHLAYHDPLTQLPNRFALETYCCRRWRSACVW